MRFVRLLCTVYALNCYINCLLIKYYTAVALAGALFAEMSAGMPPIGNHSSSQLMAEKKMAPHDSKNPVSNFASAFKNKVDK